MTYPYNTPYPYTFQQNQQTMPQNTVPPVQTVQQTSWPVPNQQGGIVWVHGEQDARSYLVAPNASALLMDADSSCFYIKSVDASGMPAPLRVFDYAERKPEAVSAPSGSAVDLSMYITREEFESRLAEAKNAEKRAVPRKEKE